MRRGRGKRGPSLFSAPVAMKGVFIDKDGTLVENVPYNVDPARIVLKPEVPGAIREIASSGYRVIVVSNQPGAALGYFSERELKSVEDYLRGVLPALDGFYYCPHAPQAGCDCRKPAPGMLERAAREQGLELQASWMVGDILDDVEAGRRAGCRTVLVDNGNETEWRKAALRAPDHVVSNLLEAAHVIVGAMRR